MNESILKSCIVVLLLGPRESAEPLCEKIAEEGEKMAHIPLQGKGFESLREAIEEKYHANNRVMVVSGFPHDKDEALLVASLCPQTMAFYFSNSRVRGGKPIQAERPCEVHGAFRAQGGRIHAIDSFRPLTRQKTFVQNHLRELILGLGFNAQAKAMLAHA